MTLLRAWNSTLHPRRARKRTLKPARVVDKARLALVASMPCCVCQREGLRQTAPTEVHHMKRNDDGSTLGGQKAGDDRTIPLCWNHHWNGKRQTHPFRPTSLEEFEAAHGSELDLLAAVNRMLGVAA